MVWRKYRLDRFKWHRWYAWWPVIVGVETVVLADREETCTRWVWLEFIWRKGCAGWNYTSYDYKMEKPDANWLAEAHKLQAEIARLCAELAKAKA